MVITDPKELTKQEYELQFYGFTVAGLFAAFRRVVISEISNFFCDKIEILQALKCDDLEVALKGLEAQEKYCMEWIEAPLERLKPIFISSFTIPDNVVLYNDKYHQDYKNNIEDIRKEVKQLEEEYKELVLYKEILEERCRQVKTLESLVVSSKEFLKKYLQKVTTSNDKTKEADRLLEELKELMPACNPLKKMLSNVDR